jgi:hypothetical protein
VQDIGVIGWLTFLLAGWGSFFSAYIVVQALTLLALRGPHRYFAAITLPVMGVVVAITLEALRHASNLWPIYLIFASPLALFYLLAVGITGLKQQAHPKRRPLITAMLAVTVVACIPYGMLFAS